MNMHRVSLKTDEENLESSDYTLTNIQSRHPPDGSENPTVSGSDSWKRKSKEEENANYTTTLSSNLLATPSNEGSSLLSPRILTEYIPTQSTPLIFEDIGLDVGTLESILQLPPSIALRFATKAEESTTRSVNILVFGKRGSGKTTLINSLLGQQLGHTDAFRVGTNSIEQVLDKLKATDTSICFIDTPGIDDNSSSFVILDNIVDYIRNRPIHAILYVERLSDSRLSSFSLKVIENITKKLGSRIWRKVIIVFTFGYIFPPIEYSFEEFVRTRATSLRRMIRDAIDDQELQLPVALSETSKLCPTNDQGLKILPDGIAWFPALMDILCRRILYGVPLTYSATEQVSWNQTLSKERWLIISAAVLGGFISRTLFASQNNVDNSSQQGKSYQVKRKYNNKNHTGTAMDQKSPFWWLFKS
ncbi:Translocase of chloroplast 90, chloroplastic [Galdieria sulphuraria]|nr:Translocase of chloroplast 90, chloroplastic [Galdieria sulphuraria]